MEPLEIELTVACSPEHAFEVWTEKTSLWWPKGHSRSGDPEAVVFEPRAGGRIYERGRDGAEHDWGEVIAWEPPRRLAYLWHIYGERADATDVEVTFAAAGEGTAVRIVHGGFERLGAKGEELRKRNRQGWAGLLAHFERACAD
jgi:uncharacterized protein YndB with AHSA1/START domain